MIKIMKAFNLAIFLFLSQSVIAGTITVNNGGIIKGSGTINSGILVNTGGSLTPGLSPGCLAVESVNLSTGAGLSTELGGTTPCNGYDQLQVTGTVTLGANFNLSSYNSYVVNGGETYTVLDNDNVDAINGTFNGLTEGSILTLGGKNLSISYVGGDGNDITLKALQDQSIYFATLSNKSYDDVDFLISATTTSSLSASFVSTTLSVCSVSGSTVTLVSTGNCSITASQSGNASYNAATDVVQSFAINNASQTISFAAISTKTYGDTAFDLSATSDSGLFVSYASTTPAICSVSGSTVTLNSTGNCSITASQLGDTNYNAATDVVQSFAINKANQTINFSPLQDKLLDDADFSVIANSTSSLLVSFTSSNTSVCNINGSLVSINAIGTCELIASQVGNENYLPAPNVVHYFTINDVDSDGDGLPNNIDTDDDNDGVLDVDDVFPLDAAETTDTDGDGIGNNADTDDDGDGIADVDDSEPLDPEQGDDIAPVFGDIESVIFEASGEITAITLVAPVVTDNSSINVTLESDLADSLALGEHVITWTATDNQGNSASAEQLVSIVDTTSPEFAEQADIVMNATGRLTNISNAVTSVAIDIVDGELTAVIVGESQYLSGAHQVEFSATDNSDNSQSMSVGVNILPEISASKKASVEAGGNYTLAINLSGDAPNYPVTVDYQLVQNDDVISQYNETINSGTQGQLTINVPKNALVTDTMSVLLTSTANAFIGNDSETKLTVIETNEAPQLSLTIYQASERVSIIDPTKGIVTIKAVVRDVNQLDNHDISWVENNNSFIDEAIDDDPATFELNPSGLGEEGATVTYPLDVEVIESNTTENLSVNHTLQLLIESPILLSINNDSDNDGIPDSEEGYTDIDGDGIADYLDNDSNITRLPIVAGGGSLQTSSGLAMSLGRLVLASVGSLSSGASLNMKEFANTVPAGSADTSDNHYTAISPVYNFVISNLANQGDSVSVVIPLEAETSVSEGTMYRKYNTSHGWYTFVEDEHNSIKSASTDEHGHCPDANDVIYTTGLTAGDNCVELTIEDGGPNDTDFNVNSEVEDPGVFVIEQQNHAPEIIMATSYQINENTELTFDASGTIDAEGDKLSFNWLQLSGSEVTLDDTDEVTLTFTSPEIQSDETLTFELTVDDGRDTATMLIEVLVNQVNKVPTISIDSHNESYDENSTVTLTSQGSDSDGDTLIYTWEQISGVAITFNDTTASGVSITLPSVNQDEVIELQFTVSDGSSSISTTTTLSITDIVEVITIIPPKKNSGGGSMVWLIVIVLFVSVSVRKYGLSSMSA